MEITLDRTYQEKWGQSGFHINVAGLHTSVVINKGFSMNATLVRF